MSINNVKFLPKDLNDSIKEIIAWKRFSDFKDLNEHMQEYHVSLHRRDKFPEFPRPKFFGRFDEKTVEERRQCSLRLLQFIGSQAHLYKHPKFIDFLAVTKYIPFNDKRVIDLSNLSISRKVALTSKPL